MKNIRGKKAVITGAASGIGRALALALAAEGADLYLLDIDDAKLAVTVDEARETGVAVTSAHCDLARPSEITASIRTILGDWGKVDLLVNNAGVAYFGPTERMTADQWNWLLGINLLAPIQFTRELLPVLLAQREAHILNVCSIAGLVAWSELAAYNVSKFGLVGFSQSLRAEYGPQGLGVTALCPGFVRTNIYQAALNGRGAKPVPEPKPWLTAPPEKVAQRAIQAIKHKQGLVLVTPMARMLWYLQRLSPRCIDWFNRLTRIGTNSPPAAQEPGVSKTDGILIGGAAVSAARSRRDACTTISPNLVKSGVHKGGGLGDQSLRGTKGS